MQENIDNPDEIEERDQSDRGSTFVEIVVSIVLIGIVVIAILTAVSASLKASSVVFEAAGVETVLLNAADRVERATIRDCDYDAQVEAAQPAEGGWDIKVVSHQELFEDASGANYWGGCVGPFGAFDVEKITISVTNTDLGITRTITVVKSEVS